jgi:hypothetical protein
MRLFGLHFPSSQAASRLSFNDKSIVSIALLASRPKHEIPRRLFLRSRSVHESDRIGKGRKLQQPSWNHSAVIFL